jgi:hypothetical protein
MGQIFAETAFLSLIAAEQPQRRRAGKSPATQNSKSTD